MEKYVNLSRVERFAERRFCEYTKRN